MIEIIFRQILIMFLLSAVGFVMYKTKKIGKEGSKNIGNILIYLSLPCAILNSFLTQYSKERLFVLGISTVLSFAVLVLSMLISRMCFGKHALDNFAASFSNPGFFGVPLVLAAFQSGAVFYVASFIAFLNLFQWTYGVFLLENSDENGVLNIENEKENGLGIMLKDVLHRLVKAPSMLAIAIGLFFFMSDLSMPKLLGEAIRHIVDLNTPLAMFTIGIYAAQTDLGKMFFKPRLYLVSVVKLILIPIITIVLFKFIPNCSLELKTCVLIVAACPVGSNIAVYAQLYDKDYRYAVETVVISAIFSALTLPVILAISNMYWQ